MLIKMIVFEEIKARELVQVLIDDPRYDCIAKVLSNEKTYLIVTYLSPTDKAFKGAKVFSFDSTAERLDFDSIITHHPEIIDVTEIGLRLVAKNMYVYEDDIDPDSESEVETDEEDSSSEEEESDEDEKGDIKSRDLELDEQWNSWKPSSAGAARFKDKIDQIESFIKHRHDSY